MSRSTIVCILLIPTAFFAAGWIPLPLDFPKIDGSALLEHIKALSSDLFEGRAPGTEGENRTVAYIETQFKNLGLKPGNVDGSYLQKVPMVGITPDPAMTLIFRKGDKLIQLKYLEDFVAWTRRIVTDSALQESPLLFVGYGAQAPEFNWDDYKGVDVRGKTLVMLINDPPVPDPGNPKKLDPKVFGGDAMTYYGRWTYKYDIGGEKGAAGVLIVHETDRAGYPWSVVKGFGGERFNLVSADNNMRRSNVEAWIGLEQAKRLFAMAGQNFDALKKQAATRAFRPVPLDVVATVALHNKMRTIVSHNVVAKVEGKDPKLKDEYVIYTAHWDHLGVGLSVNGDRIYHGAVDNASGVAGLIEIAKAFKRLPVAPERSILFLSVTGEEQGLLGSEYYAKNPIYPLAKTLAEINMDGLNVHGRTKDIAIVGLGNSELDDYARQAAAGQSRVLAPDPEPEKGFYYRSDHFSFALQGVPALDPKGGIDYIGKPAGYGKNIQEDYTAHDYHKPSDVIKPDWDMSGAVEDLQLLWMVGCEVANSDHYPQWKPGTEFKARREAQLKALQ
jgi:Zn-dependent M28 family amino/carboxypeptidase